jgi:hypothetical protein
LQQRVERELGRDGHDRPEQRTQARLARCDGFHRKSVALGLRKSRIARAAENGIVELVAEAQADNSAILPVLRAADFVSRTFEGGEIEACCRRRGAACVWTNASTSR